MIVAAVLNGWASSVSKTRTHHLVEELLVEHEAPFVLKGLKSSFFWSRSRELAKWIQRQESRDSRLLCVGKSLGARHMVERVLNQCFPTGYGQVRLVTIDPNWPEFWDWTPNLNRQSLKLAAPVTCAVNLYVAGEPRQQCGARLMCTPTTECHNIIVPDCDHYSIVESPTVREVLDEIIDDMAG